MIEHTSDIISDPEELEEEQEKAQREEILKKIDISDPNKYSTPYTIVWTTLPLISWFLPFIGHTGITE